MILSDVGLKAALADDSLRVEPLWPTAMQPNSIDLHLGPTIRRPPAAAGMVALQLPRRLHEVDARVMLREEYGMGEVFTLKPGEFALGRTAEWVQLGPGLMGWATGCSTVARCGLMVEMAGLIDAGFKGTLTLELVNLAPFPLLLAVGERIGQLVVARLEQPAARPYATPGLGSRYQGQIDATAAMPQLPQFAPREGSA